MPLAALTAPSGPVSLQNPVKTLDRSRGARHGRNHSAASRAEATAAPKEEAQGLQATLGKSHSQRKSPHRRQNPPSDTRRRSDRRQSWPGRAEVSPSARSTMGTDATHVSIARCDPAIDKQALALATAAWPDSERAAYQQTIVGLLKTGQANQIVLLAARGNEGLIAAQLAQSLPGRAAVVWQPQFGASHDVRRDDVSAALFQRLTTELTNAGAQLAQALVPIGDRAAGERFSAGGFSHA